VDRADLVRLALHRAGEVTAGHAVLLGDTPADVAAGRAARVRAIAWVMAY
jgi:beta-phosphoglucomutase-like phosphatase (HAD superfamily)